MSNCPQDLLIPLLASISSGDANPAPFSDMVAKYPKDPQLRFLYATVLAESGLSDMASREFGQCLSLSPGHSLARFLAGLLEFLQGRFPAAVELWAPLSREHDRKSLWACAVSMMALELGDTRSSRQLLAIAEKSPDIQKELISNLENMVQSQDRNADSSAAMPFVYWGPGAVN
jgi:Flp pilus assembly protein TadD